MTILCSSCLGGGLLDIHRNPPGVLLAAVYETQINIKAVKTGDVKDPWTFAILHEIERAWKRKKRMPSYVQLLNQARLYVRSMLDSGALAKSYEGPSPDAAKPIAWQEGGPMEGHQDPQLVYNGWYIDADRTPFLDPFPVPVKESLSPPQDDGPTRYPHVEL